MNKVNLIKTYKKTVRLPLPSLSAVIVVIVSGPPSSENKLMYDSILRLFISFIFISITEVAWSAIAASHCVILVRCHFGIN